MEPGPFRETERRMTKRRGKIDAAPKAQIALEALRARASLADLVQHHQIHPKQISEEAASGPGRQTL